jgi:4-amino-4-deoxy-L-arabinose transferase-like glycosyltransferase
MDVFALRLPSALAGLGSVLVTFYLATLFSTPHSGVLAALLLLSTYGFIATSQEGRVDSLFNFFVTLSIAAWLTGFVRYRAQGIAQIPSRYYRYAALACGLAVLTKGPLGLVHVGMVLSTITLFQGGFKALFSLLRPEWVWALLIPTPWYLLAVDAGGDNFVGRQFVYENLRRFTGGAGISKRVWWFYFPHLIFHCGPWSLPFFGIIAQQIKRRGQELLNKSSPLPWLGIRIGVLWFTVIFFFLNISAGKHPSYLAPTLPAISIAVAIWLSHYASLPSLRSRIVEISLIAIIIAAITLPPLFVVVGSYQLITPSFLTRTFASLPEALSGNSAIFWSVHTSLSLFIIYLIRVGRTQTQTINRWGPPILLTLVLVLGVDCHLARAIKGVTHGYATVGRTLRAIVPPDQTLHWVLRTGQDPRLGVGREDSFDGLFFYLRRRVKRLDDTKTWNTPGLYVARQSWIDAQSEEWKARVQTIFRGGKIADKEPQKLVYFELRD